MKNYIELLNTEPIIKRLSLVQLISYFGAWFSNVAIYTLLIELNVSVEIISFVAMLHFLAGIVQAPFSGSIIDSFPPKKLMLVLIVIEFFSTLSLIFISSLSDLWLLYILILLKMSAASFYFTTEMSLLPKILKSNKLQIANELHSIIWSFSYTIGISLSGFIVYLLGVKVAFILDSTMFIFCFFLLYNLELRIPVNKSKEKILLMIKDTFIYLKNKPYAIHLMFIHAFIGLTAFDALVALMVNKYYASIIATSLALGFIHSSRAIGLIIGPILFNKWVNNQRLIYIFIFQAFSIWLWAILMQNFYLSLVASVFVGLFTTTLWSYTYTLLQKNIDDKYYGRVIAYNDMLFLINATLTSFFIGFLSINNYSLEFITFILGFGFIIGAIYLTWILKTYNIKDI